jgi:UDP-glucose 4-epimerase
MYNDTVFDENNMFNDSTLLITGGTGSFGNAVLHRFIGNPGIKEIRIFSRDELKQDNMRHEYQMRYPSISNKLKFYIGNVRDISSVRNAMIGVDYIFHAAALKQVPSCEFFPMEAVQTNVLGTDNVLTAAIESKVKCVVCLSTDKAAYPVNAMGTSKAMMEKVIVAKSRNVEKDATRIMCTRYGNVIGSRGSVIPLFINQIKEGKELTVTDPNMTRFIMSLDEAVNLVMFAFKNGVNGDILVQKADATTIDVLAEAVKQLYHYKKENKIIGIRHGEKRYETLLTNEECSKAIDLGKFYRVPSDKRDLNYDNFLSKGTDRNGLTEFNSNNTKLLTVEETMHKLMSIEEIRIDVEKWNKED